MAKRKPSKKTVRAGLRRLCDVQADLDEFLEMRKPDLAVKALRFKEALILVAACIWRHEENNTCGLGGGATIVHAVEDVLGIKTPATPINVYRKKKP